MTTVWDAGTAISGAGSTRRVGTQLRVVLTVIPGYLSATSPAPLYYRSLGLVGALAGDSHERPQNLQWADSSLDPLPAGADAVYWRLVNGVSGTLYQGLELDMEPGIGCRVYRTTTQTIPNDTGTALSFDAQTDDPYGLHSPSTNPTRLTAPAPGWYMVGGCVRWAPHATGNRSMSVRVNGVTQVGKDYQPTVTDGNNMWQVINVPTYLNAGDYIEIMVTQNSGGALDVGVNPNNSPEGWLVQGA